MRYLLTALIIIIFSCQQQSSTTQVQSKITDSSKLYIPAYSVNKFEGTYSGSFGDGYMTLVLNYVNGKNASGFNIHKGNRRNINGELQPAAAGYQFTMKEPGDNPYDGIFTFTIDTVNFTISGQWDPFDSSKTKARSFTLQKQKIKSLNSMSNWAPGCHHREITALILHWTFILKAPVNTDSTSFPGIQHRSLYL